jgi:hypothetical protein
MGQEEVLGVWWQGNVRAQKGEVPPVNVLCLSSLPLSRHHSQRALRVFFFFVSVTTRHTDWEKYIMGQEEVQGVWWQGCVRAQTDKVPPLNVLFLCVPYYFHATTVTLFATKEN